MFAAANWYYFCSFISPHFNIAYSETCLRYYCDKAPGKNWTPYITPKVIHILED